VPASASPAPYNSPYKNSDLDFAQIVVAAKNFLAVWQVSSIPVPIRIELSAENGAPNAIGRKYARRYAARKNELLKLASWDGADLFTPLVLAQPDIVLSRIDARAALVTRLAEMLGTDA
jgi:hypothetical protein